MSMSTSQKTPPRSRGGGSTSTRRRWGWLLAAALVVVTLLAVGKQAAMGGLASSQVDQGVAALVRAVKSGDAEAFDDARGAFRDAASVSVFDHYPAFLLAMSERLRELSAGGSAPATRPGDPVLQALVAGEWEQAERRAAAMGAPGDRAREYWTRFAAAMRAQAMKAS